MIKMSPGAAPAIPINGPWMSESCRSSTISLTSRSASRLGAAGASRVSSAPADEQLDGRGRQLRQLAVHLSPSRVGDANSVAGFQQAAQFAERRGHLLGDRTG
jgi:hypothetical protein